MEKKVAFIAVIITSIIGMYGHIRGVYLWNSECVNMPDLANVAQWVLSQINPGDIINQTYPAGMIITYHLRNTSPELVQWKPTVSPGHRLIGVTSKAAVIIEPPGIAEYRQALAKEQHASPEGMFQNCDPSQFEAPQLLRTFETVSVYVARRKLH